MLYFVLDNGMQRMLWYLQSMQGFYSSKTLVHRWNLVRHLATKLQQTNCILCECITNSRDHRPLSKLLRHTVQGFFSEINNLQEWQYTLALSRWLLRHSFELFIPMKNPCTACLTYTNIYLVKLHSVHYLRSENQCKADHYPLLTNDIYALISTINCRLTYIHQLFDVQNLTK